MKINKKVISTILAATLVAGVLTGCGSDNKENSATENTSKKETLADTKAQLSSPKYDFEKEYAFGDFNRHSNADMDRQNGVDTFEDKEIVFKDISYDQLMNLMQQEGNFLIQLSGSWCHNSRAMGPSVNEFAKKNGIDTIYSYDFNVDNGEDGSMFVRMTNGKDTVGAKYNYMYGEMVSRFLTNLDDWIEYPSDSDTAISYTNSAGKEVTVGRLQQPIMFLYNKDNTKDNSGKGVARGKFPVVYAFEQMVERDEKGLYVKETDAEGNDVLDKEGKPVRKYVTEEYRKNLMKIFDYIKNNKIELAHYDKEKYMKDAFNSYGKEIFKANEKVNIYPITYRQLEWLTDQDGNSLVMIGGPGSEKTRSIISTVNQYAVKNNVRVYMYDPQIDGAYTTDKWGYKQTTNILEENSPIVHMYKNLIDRHLTNLEGTRTMEDGTTIISAPYFFEFNKDAKDEDGFVAPIASFVEMPYTSNPEARYFIGKEKNLTACKESILTVMQKYGELTGVKIQDLK